MRAELERYDSSALWAVDACRAVLQNRMSRLRRDLPKPSDSNAAAESVIAAEAGGPARASPQRGGDNAGTAPQE